MLPALSLAAFFAWTTTTAAAAATAGDGSIRAATPYLSALREVRSSILPNKQFFFPGHSSGRFVNDEIRDIGLHTHDLPELDGLDNIHAPEPQGPLSASLGLAANLWGAKQSWFLVNGSTGGLLAAILAFTRAARRRERKRRRRGAGTLVGSTKRPTLIVTRDAHKAVFDALSIAQIDAFVLPCRIDDEFGVSLGPNPTTIMQTLEQIDASEDVVGMVLTRPTYQGVVLPAECVKSISRLLQEKWGAPLLIDEAHGAHLRFLEGMEDGLACGAAVVVQSTHKTLTSPSQTAMMHSAGGFWKEQEEDLHACFSALTTTSPNSVLLAALDAARAHMEVVGEGRKLLHDAVAAANILREELKKGGVRVFGSGGDDPLRLSVGFADAVKIDDELCEEHGIFCELNLPRCITYILPLGLDVAAAKELAEKIVLAGRARGGEGGGLEREEQKEEEAGAVSFIDTQMTLDGLEEVSLSSPDEIIGAVSAETVCLYPPGIPIVIRGERIQPQTASRLLGLGRNLLPSGTTITGMAEPGQLRVFSSESEGKERNCLTRTAREHGSTSI